MTFTNFPRDFLSWQNLFFLPKKALEMLAIRIVLQIHSRRKIKADLWMNEWTFILMFLPATWKNKVRTMITVASLVPAACDLLRLDATLVHDAVLIIIILRHFSSGVRVSLTWSLVIIRAFCSVSINRLAWIDANCGKPDRRWQERYRYPSEHGKLCIRHNFCGGNLWSKNFQSALASLRRKALHKNHLI